MMARAASSDVEQIREVVHRYSMALDRRDLEALAECFTADCEFVVSGEARLDAADSSALTYGPGWREVAPLVESTAARFKIGSHFVGQSAIEIFDDARARAETYGMSFAVPLSGSRLMFRGVRYLDDLSRVDDQWLIRRRTLTLDWAADANLTFAQDFGDRVGQAAPC